MVIRPAQQGVVLISVVTALAIIAAISLLLDLHQGMRANSISKQHDTAVKNALAEAGLRDALWRARKGVTYPTIVTGTLPGHGTYQARITKDPLNAAKITIDSQAALRDGAEARLGRSYTLACQSGTTTTTITKYDSDGNPHSITENYLSSLQKGYLHPRNNTNDRSRSLIRFDYGTVPPAGATIASATLMLDVQQHDPAMAGATLYVNRVLQDWDDREAEWRFAEDKKAWLSPDGRGGHFTLVDQGIATIAATTLIYQIDITAIMQAWIKGSTNDGLIIRTDGITNGGSAEFRLKKNTGSWPSTQWPRLEVKWC